MMTVNEVSKMTGVSIRTLQYYDRIGLLKPPGYTEAGYRLYDEAALERLQQILLFRELEFPLKEIKAIVDTPEFDREEALEQQIELLMLKKEHIENLIAYAREIKDTGGKRMDFSVFDNGKLEEYAQKAKEKWGGTAEYREYEDKAAGRTKEEEKQIGTEFMKLFAKMGEIKSEAPDSETAQALVKQIQEYITKHYYQCDKKILLSLGQAYAAGGEFTENIDKVGGVGTGAFAYEAIKVYCGE